MNDIVGIVHIRECLIRADEIIVAHQKGDCVIVTVGEWDHELTIRDCTIEEFLDAWRRALS